MGSHTNRIFIDQQADMIIVTETAKKISILQDLQTKPHKHSWAKVSLNSLPNSPVMQIIEQISQILSAMLLVQMDTPHLIKLDQANLNYRPQIHTNTLFSNRWLKLRPKINIRHSKRNSTRRRPHQMKTQKMVKGKRFMEKMMVAIRA